MVCCSELTILSSNCQGLGDRAKRKDVFSFLRNKRYNIYCLQDTHFIEENEHLIRNEWGYDCIFSSYKSNSRGVAILLNNNFEFKLRKIKRDCMGNYVCIDIQIDNKNITLINLYGPNKDSPTFFDTIPEIIEQFANDNIIICGDFNLVLNSDLDYDKGYKNINNPNSRQKVLEIIENYALSDIFRELHSNSRRYTWRKNNPRKQARLDFFLISENLLPSVKTSDIDFGYRSDHSFPKLVLKFNEFKHGKGLWKYNNALLNDPEFLNIINQCILDTKIQCCAPVYNYENIGNIPEDEIQFIIDDQLFLETVLMNIRGKSISYSSFKKKEMNLREEKLNRDIQKLEQQADPNLEFLEQKKKELEDIRIKRIKGCIIRSKARWLEEGEKPTRYFFNLENRNYTSKIIPKLQKENSTIITKQEEILEEAKSFNENLFDVNNNCSNTSEITCKKLDEWLGQNEIPKLNHIESQTLEGPITLSEAGKTLRQMKNNKSPGSDGFTAEFFKCFWRQLGTFIIRSINLGYANGNLSVTQRQGIIVCIPKTDKPKHFIENWRPISLLNIIYKIASGTIANRLKSVLNKLINKDQTGFLSGRYIGEITRLIYDLMQYTEENDIPGLLFIIDFKKAFDSVSWKFISEVLRFFQFGDSILRWVKTLHSNVSSAINLGGNLSSFFNIHRGCRQGDPIASYIFILCVEILASRLRHNENVKGIKIDDCPILISQFADDTSLVLDGSESSLQNAIKDLNFFAKMSGLKINTSKTQAIWIGSMKYSNVTFLPELGLQWGRDKFTVLGIDFSVNLHEIPKMNYDKKLIKLKSLIKTWEKRILTPIGRIHIIKSLLIPQLNHLFISLPNSDDSFIHKLNSILFNFLWNSKVDKVKRDVVTKDYMEGGLKMVNTRAFIESLKLGWIRRLFQGNAKWQTISSKLFDIEKLSKCGHNFFKLCISKCKNRFWVDVLKAWQKFAKHIEDVPGEGELLKIPLWHNEKIKINNKCVFYKEWYKKGVVIVNDLLDYSKDGTFYTFQDFVNVYGIRTDFLTFNGLLRAVKKYVPAVNNPHENFPFPYIPLGISYFLERVKGSKLFYNILNKNKITPTGTRKWCEIFNIDTVTFTIFFRITFNVTKDTKLQWFQYRIYHYILSTNAVLFKAGIVATPQCTLCNNDRETITHIMWDCREVQKLLEHFSNLLEILDISYDIDKESFIFSNIGSVNENKS